MATIQTYDPVLNLEQPPATSGEWNQRWPIGSAANHAITKLVIGSLRLRVPSEQLASTGPVPDDLATRFPSLTHLHLWGLSELTSLSKLPSGLQHLDLRQCQALQVVHGIPSTIEQLVLEDNPQLTEVTLPGPAPALWDLSLRNCVGLPEPVLLALVRHAPKLQMLDLSECALLSSLPGPWPDSLERIELNRCAKLSGLPATWPAGLRRLGLRGASALRRLPEFEAWPDYLDLAGTSALKELKRPTGGRTLFLYGSGVRVPPASEHGAEPDENVAARLKDFYQDLDLFGRGQVQRCKVLVLGNGDAGKTCLSAALVPGGDPVKAAAQGSTHGVQFWPWAMQGLCLPESGQACNVAVHVWDFGGQEIYHQTHKLFMAKGAIFVIVWDPEQDGRQPAPTPEGFQDVWRPPEYWVEFIRQACPWNPQIMIVRSKSTQVRKAEQERVDRLAKQAGLDLKIYAVDSLPKNGEKGQIEDVLRWINTAVARVVETQGSTVPLPWEAAQNLIESWFPSTAPGQPVSGAHPRYTDITREELIEQLSAHISEAAKSEPKRFQKLSAALSKPDQLWTPLRIDRLLDFLTHSGWIFWDPQLFEDRIIVGQRWALEGIYAGLDRRTGEPVYTKLRESNGRFRSEELHELVWAKAGYTEPQQRLLLSYMEQAGVVFALVSEKDSYWGKAVYVSLAHLPRADELRLGRRFERERSPERGEVHSKTMHRAHWNAILIQLAKHYGTDGEYAEDGFLVENKDGQVIYLTCTLDAQQGLGGSVMIAVSGSAAKKRLQSLKGFIEGLLPRDPLSNRSPVSIEESSGPAANRKRLFISYAWNPRPNAEQEGFVEALVAQSYEVPVDKIEKLMQEFESEWTPLRDRERIKSGDDVTAFIQQVRNCDKVLFVHSDKYWRSWYCMAEICLFLASLKEKGRSLADNSLFVQLGTSQIDESGAKDGYLQFWRQIDRGTMPTRLEGLLKTSQAAQDRYISFFSNEASDLHAQYKNKRWVEDDDTGLLRWLKQELGIKET